MIFHIYRRRPAPNTGDSQTNIERHHKRERAVKKERRWLKSAIAASLEQQVTLPWTRRKPEAPKDSAAPKRRALAAR